MPLVAGGEQDAQRLNGGAAVGSGDAREQQREDEQVEKGERQVCRRLEAQPVVRLPTVEEDHDQQPERGSGAGKADRERDKRLPARLAPGVMRRLARERREHILRANHLYVLLLGATAPLHERERGR